MQYRIKFYKNNPSRHTTSFQRLCDVYTTSLTSYRRRIDVETTSRVYWDSSASRADVKISFPFGFQQTTFSIRIAKTQTDFKTLKMATPHFLQTKR